MAEDDDWTRLKEIDSFMCPMSLCLMDDPVSTCDGQSYERAEIERWLASHDTSPATGLTLQSKHLVPNLGLKKAIEEFALDPLGKKLLQMTKYREDGQEPAFPGGGAGGGEKEEGQEGGEEEEEDGVAKENNGEENEAGVAAADDDEPVALELLIVGPTGVGKSSLLRRLRDGDFSDTMDSTIGLDYETKRFRIGGSQPCSVNIWDTSGQALFRDTLQTQCKVVPIPKP